jgi:hypothetical protein
VLCQQRLDFAAQFLIALAGFGHEHRTAPWHLLESGMKEMLNLLPAFGFH